MTEYVLRHRETPDAEESLSCIIIDDEPIALRGMELLVSRHRSLCLKGVFSDPLLALEWLESHPTDLVFLDIEMPGIKGIDLASRLPSQTMVVFTTAYSEYAVLSYELDAVDYLVKPFTAARFDMAVRKSLARQDAKAGQSLPQSSQILTLRADRRFVNIHLDDIIFIEGVKDYVKIHTDSERIISRITIKTLLEQLPRHHFLRIHKSYIINISRVKAHNSTKVTLSSSSTDGRLIELPIGMSFRSDLLRACSHKYT